MARIDVSALLLDTDFTDRVTLIRRTVSVNEYGETVITEASQNITAVVQGGNTEQLTKQSDSARLTDQITIWYRGVLTAESSGGYSDIIVWGGKRYQLTTIDEDFSNYGRGFTRAVGTLEQMSNG